MKNSSAIFQRTIEKILEHISGLVIYQDDILIHAKSENELAKRVSCVLSRLAQKDVTVNKEKSVLNARSIKFLGYLLSKEGIRPDPEIVSKITSCKPPQNKGELESFLGLINFFGRMIKDFARMTQPLNQLRRKDVPFNWTSKQQLSFEKLLEALSSNPVLQSYSLQDEATVTTDASEKAIGAVLTQDGKPVMFISRSLSDTEQRYSNIEREALAIVWSCQRLRNLLLGRHFTLVTDHQPLLKIYGGDSLPKVASSRLVRWAIILQPFDFEIKYKTGKSIAYADALTRLKFSSDKETAQEEVINDYAEDGVSNEVLLRAKNALKFDKLAQDIIRRVTTKRWSHCRLDEVPFKRVQQTLEYCNGALTMNGRLYLPPVCRKDSFEVAHELHTGVESTVNRLKMGVWWPTMKRDVNDWIRKCSTCAKTRPLTRKFPGSWEKTDPFSRVHGDWCYVKDVGNILLLVDSSTGWIEASTPMPRTSQNVIQCLVSLSCRFGVPRTFVTDNAPEFFSVEVNRWCSENGVQKVETPPYHPASNGSAERAVQTVKQCLRAWKENNTKIPFREYLQHFIALPSMF